MFLFCTEIDFIQAPAFLETDLPVVSLVLHTTDVSEDQTIRLFKTGEAKTSAAYVVGKQGKITQFIKEENQRGRTCGTSDYKNMGLPIENITSSLNEISTSIEIVNLMCLDHKNPPVDYPYDEFNHHYVFGEKWDKFPPEQIETVIALTKKIMMEEKILPHMVVTHSLISGYRKWGDPSLSFPLQKLFEEGIIAYPTRDQTNNPHYIAPKDFTKETIFEYGALLGFLTPADYQRLYPNGMKVFSWKEYAKQYHEKHGKNCPLGQLDTEINGLKEIKPDEEEIEKWCIATYEAFLALPITGLPSEKLCKTLAELLAIHKAIEKGDFDNADKAGEFIKKNFNDEILKEAYENLRIVRNAAKNIRKANHDE